MGWQEQIFFTNHKLRDTGSKIIFNSGSGCRDTALPADERFVRG